MHTIFVYGTLRPGNTQPLKVHGRMFDLGWYPGVILGGPDTFTVERVQVPDLAPFDLYEGYHQDDLSSLYIRRSIEVDGDVGWIYEYNQRYDAKKLIASGDWLTYTNEPRGSNSQMVTRLMRTSEAA